MLAAQPISSEFLADNDGGRIDAAGRSSDWIEIHNAGDQAIDLAGWHLTDDPLLPGKWEFPTTVLQPDAYLVVFASGDGVADSGGNLHTNFQLNAGGEYLALTRTDGSVADEFAPSYPKQFEDVSYGVTTSSVGYFPAPTPGEPNGPSVEGFVGDTSFDVDRGFYDQPFDVQITTKTPGATIVYTTDGSEPTLSHGTQAAAADDASTPLASVHVETTTTLRAAAFKDGFEPTNIDTQTYLFLADVIRQPTNPPGVPLNWNGFGSDFQMDPDVVDDPRYSDELIAGLKSIPTLSIVGDPASFWSSTDGIYIHPNRLGIEYERPVSLEWINPDGSTMFQEDAGIRIWGTGWRPHSSTLKHTFQLKFKSIYGETKLRHPIFPDAPVEAFDDLILRAQGSRGWTDFRSGGLQIEATQYIHDAWARDTARDMGKIDGHSTYVHLYLNGLYWGLYNPVERPTGNFGEEYFGGENDDYDVISHRVGQPVIANEGDKVAWDEMQRLANAGVASAEAYAAIQEYVDVDNLIDYMLLNQYATNHDGPASGNNLRALRKRAPGEPFRFYVWDMEYTFWGQTENSNINVDVGNTIARVYARLRQNPEFRLRYADRAHKNLFNDGALTPEKAAARWQARADEIFTAVVAESARWGDFRRPTNPYTRDGQWTTELNRLMNQYFPQRTDILLSHLRSAGLYPSVDAPSFNRHGGKVAGGFKLAMTNENGSGTIYYTLDGSDPRLEGGAIRPGAFVYDGDITLGDSTQVKARVRTVGGQWSALNDATFLIGLPQLAISEIHFNPAEAAVGNSDNDDFEFIEIYNYGTVPVELDGVRLSNGVDFDFSGSGVSSLAPGHYAVAVRNLAAFATRYDTVGMEIIGEYLASGTKLSNGGERVALVDAFDQTIAEFRYRDGWYDLTDGAGFSLTRTDPADASADLDQKTAWRPSSDLHGSPGRADSLAAPDPGAVVINEVLAHSDEAGDWIELLNTTDAAIDVGGWFLSNGDNETGRLDPLKYEIPSGTIISAGGLATFTEQQHFGEKFTLSELGDEIILQAARDGALLGYRAREDFGASDGGVTFGRFIKSTLGKDFVALESATFGETNAAPLVGPVVFHEIMYNPGSGGGSEFVELMNVSGAAVSLAGWHFEGISYTFGSEVMVEPGELVVVVPHTPTEFRATHAVPEDAVVFGPYLGSLSNAGESLRLRKPGEPVGEVNPIIPSVMVDRVSYDDKFPWPVAADGTGAALQRITPAQYGNEPENWSVTLPGGTPGDFAVPPRVTEVLIGRGKGGYSIPAGSQQLQTLPWIGLDRISIRFSEHVEVSEDDLRVAGVNVPAYAFAGFQYEQATQTATWTLARHVGADKLLVELSSTVRDASGLPLDGNWTDTVSSFPSGNGAIDGDSNNGDAFGFRINVVAGDVTGDGRVDRADLIDLIHSLGDRGVTADSLRHDLTGDGRVDVDDLRAALLQMGSRLPAGSPQTPGSATPQAAVDALFERLGGAGAAGQDAVISSASDLSMSLRIRASRSESSFARRLGRAR